MKVSNNATPVIRNGTPSIVVLEKTRKYNSPATATKNEIISGIASSSITTRRIAYRTKGIKPRTGFAM